MDRIGKVSSFYPAMDKSNNKPSGKESFVNILKGFVNKVDSQLKYADKKMEAFALQKESNIHEVMIAMEKADLSLKFLIRIRNKLVEAYQEIMRMQV